MGLIIGRFRRKKSTYDILEKLENEIISIEEFSRSTEQFRKKIIARFILLAFSIYFLLACILYMYYNRISSNQKLMYFIPLIAFPFVIWFIKKFLAWYYSNKLYRNEKKLKKLKDEKKKILNNVMETETYKIAKTILDKFGYEKKPLTISEIPSTSNLAKTNQTGSGLRQRQSFGPQPTNTRLSLGIPKTPLRSQVNPSTPENIFNQASTSLAYSPRPSISQPMQSLATPRITGTSSSLPQLPRSILPSNRSILVKMVDYLVGDGPSNRYALICKNCHNHNGMVFKEEIEYFSYNCAYCSHFNPAKKKKPSGPKFEATSNVTEIDESSESDKDSADSESEDHTLEKTDRRLLFDSPPLNIETRNSSPEAEKSSDPEKNSDFDKLSDFDYRENENSTVFDNTSEIAEISNNPFEIPERLSISDNTTEIPESLSVPLETKESPMEIDQDKSRTDVQDNNEA